MNSFAILLDSRPRYLQDTSGPASLLLAPLGPATVLQYLNQRLSSVGYSELTIATTFEPEPGYYRRIADSGVRVDAIVPTRELAARVADYEPSDLLLMLDPRCFPSMGLEASALLPENGRGHHCVRHLVALEAHPGGTVERVQFDAKGTVRRIQRYYDSATWPFAAGVACSLLPVSCTNGASELPFASLRDLRRSLAERGVLSTDVPIEGGAFDLSREGDLIGLSERVVLDYFSGRRPGNDDCLEVGNGCQIHPSACLVGLVVLQDGVVIGPNATVVGPAVIGSGARVERDAVVAQCVVGSGSVIPAGLAVRHRAVFGAVREADPAATPASLAEPTSSLPASHGTSNDGGRTAVDYAFLKAALDVTASSLGLLLLSPILLLIALLIKLESKGPAFYRDRREGKGGRVFECLKFRTMFSGAGARQRELMAKNQVDGPQFKIAHDPRVTRLGRVLRMLNLDELPQLINVLSLEMSLVGPRPSPFRENQLCVPWRAGRLSVRPGITGLWQVCRHDRSHGDFQQWIHFDLLYVRHMSFLVDLKILAATVLTLGGRWPVSCSWILPPRDLQKVNI